MLSCKELVQQHASDYIDHHLSARQRIGVSLHLMMCSHCRRFVRQLQVVRKVLALKPEPAPEKTVQEMAVKLLELRTTAEQPTDNDIPS